MESLRNFCCKTIRVQSHLRGMVKSLVGSVQGISIFVTFYHRSSEYEGVNH
jgi:hypothetical protein